MQRLGGGGGGRTSLRSYTPQAAVEAVAAGGRVLGAQDNELVRDYPVFFPDPSNAPPVVERLTVPLAVPSRKVQATAEQG